MSCVPCRRDASEKTDRPDRVDLRVAHGILDRAAHVRLGGEMEADLGVELRERGVDGGRVAHIALDERGRTVQILRLAGGEVVEHEDGIAALHERVDQMRADEARAACDQGPHGRESYVAAIRNRSLTSDVLCA